MFLKLKRVALLRSFSKHSNAPYWNTSANASKAGSSQFQTEGYMRRDEDARNKPSLS